MYSVWGLDTPQAEADVADMLSGKRSVTAGLHVNDRDKYCIF
jgi:hypothetical protein